MNNLNIIRKEKLEKIKKKEYNKRVRNMTFKEIMYYNFMDFEEKKSKLQRAVGKWKKNGATLREALASEGVDANSLTNFEKDYLSKLLEN